MLARLIIEPNYINMLSSELRNFKKSGESLWRFSCVVCGDSKKVKTKARAYIYRPHDKNCYFYKCHNCGHSETFYNFLKTQNPMLFADYVKDIIMEEEVEEKELEPAKPPIHKFSKPKFKAYEPFKDLKKVSQIPDSHMARKYVLSRQIPSRFHHKLLYAPKFMTLVNEIIPGKFSTDMLKNDEPRLIIPFLDKDTSVFGFQGRSFKADTKLRYITIMIDETKSKIFGLDTVDFTKKVYYHEGPIDSMFIENSLGMAGSDGYEAMINPERDVVIYDNEPRNKVIVKKINNSLASGHNVVIWPKSLIYKDINDMILSGYSASEVKNLIDTNTYRGTMGMLELYKWKKVDI